MFDHPDLSHALVHERRADLLRAAERRRLIREVRAGRVRPVPAWLSRIGRAARWWPPPARPVAAPDLPRYVGRRGASGA